jgi:hypothetical protein
MVFQEGLTRISCLIFLSRLIPGFSIGIGVGVGTNNIYFDKTTAEVAGTTTTLRFRNIADTNNYKKI